MATYRKPHFSQTFTEYCAVNGTQYFFQPSTIELPQGITLNQYGWIDCPTSGDIIIPIASIRPDEDRNLFWFSEKIVSNSSNPVRMSLEGNVTFNQELGEFDPNAWFVQNGYMVSNMKNHDWSGGLIKTKPGEAMRLRVYSSTGNNNDFYFKFIAYDVPVS